MSLKKRKYVEQTNEDIKCLKKRLGDGSSGSVYEHENNPLRAFKVIEDIKDGKREGFLHRYAYQVNSLQIPEIFSEKQENQTWVIEMEKFEGPLEDGSGTKVTDQFRMKEEKLKQFTLSFVSLLESLHQADFIHGDLTPRNLFWSNDRVKLIDFGHSAIFSGAGIEGIQIPSEEIPLECRKPSGIYSKASEWYCMGRVLYILFTGENWDSGYSAIVRTRKEKHFKDNDLLRDFLSKLLHPSEIRRLSSAQAILSHPWLQSLPSPLDLARFPETGIESGIDYELGLDVKKLEQFFNQWVQEHHFRQGSDFLVLPCLFQLALQEDGWIEGLQKRLKSLSPSDEIKAARRISQLVPCTFDLFVGIMIWLRTQKIVNTSSELRELLQTYASK